jgi:hypothetical protein
MAMFGYVQLPEGTCNRLNKNMLGLTHLHDQEYQQKQHNIPSGNLT